MSCNRNCENNKPMGIIYPYSHGIMNACGCNCPTPPPIGGAQCPTGGSMQESAFMLVDNVPYIIDNTQTEYGQRINYAESVYTRITKRNDMACLNLDATIDMTEGIITNNLWNSYLIDKIGLLYDTLDGILDIQKSYTEVKMYFHVEDANGGVVYTNTETTIITKDKFHYTSINDFFVKSMKGIIITEIPALDFQGLYNFVIDKIEASVGIIHTKEHMTDQEINPFYQFTDNTTRIGMQHDAIAAVEADETILIASADINKGFPFQANLTTKMKFSFTAFTSTTIATGNTYDVYRALNNPSDVSIAELIEKVNTLTAKVETMGMVIEKLNTDVDELQTTVANIKPDIIEYAKNTEIEKGKLTYLEAGFVYQATETYTTTDDETTALADDLAADVEAGKLVRVSQ